MATASLDRYAALTSHRAMRKSTGSDEGNALQDALSRQSTTSDEIKWGQVSEQVSRIEKRLSSHHPADMLSRLNGALETADQPDLSQIALGEPSSTATPSLKQLPLTPPQLAEGGDGKSDARPPAREPGRTTPMPPRSPPTPDQTPPRRLQGTEYLKVRTTSSNASHQASSVAGSFMTAQEEFSRENLLANLHPTLRHRSRSTTPIRDSAVGLGLGLETPNGHRTPTAPSPRVVGDALAEIWPGETVESDPFLAPESLAVQEMDKQAQAAEDFQASFERAVELPAREINSRQSWDRPVSQASDYLPVDSKRLSDISTASQVVQAIVITTPRRKRQRLRHCCKNESLRTASSPIESSNRSSLVSNEGKHRPLHRTPRIDWSKRISQNSDSGISMASGPVPPPELMGRMSSLRRSSAKDRALSRRYSDLAREDPERPVTAPETSTSPREPDETQRTSSLVGSRGPAHMGRAKRTIDYPPIIPARGSSLSAPTSQNNSRTASMTSANLPKQLPANATSLAPAHAKTAPRSPQQPVKLSPKKALQRSPHVDRQARKHDAETPGDRHNSEDRYSAPRRSILTTPFSGVSALSSTPGPFEVNEATAINIFPHNNTSVLVVQQQYGTTDALTRIQPNVNLLDEVHGHARLLPPPKTFSPLRNPRPAPAPLVTLTSPTPAQDTSPTTRRSSPPTIPSRIATVRRALSGKRPSENLIAPYTQPLVQHQRQTSQPVRKSSPLWHPRAFWNDFDDPETPPQPDVYVRNTLGLPQRKLIPGPGSLSRRIGSLRRRKEAQALGEPSNGAIDDVEKRVGILARLRGQGPPIKPFASLAEAIEKLRTRRDEKKAEAQREWLRRRIGPVVLPANATQFQAVNGNGQMAIARAKKHA